MLILLGRKSSSKLRKIEWLDLKVSILYLKNTIVDKDIDTNLTK